LDEKNIEGKDALKVDGIPTFAKQRLYKDMKILDILCEMLFYPFMSRMVELNGIYHNLLILDIFKYCYRLIKHIIREYRPNELYGS